MNPTMYGAIRMTDGREWLDTCSLGWLLEIAQENTAATDQKIPGWAAANPVVRYVQVEIHVAHTVCEVPKVNRRKTAAC